MPPSVGVFDNGPPFGTDTLVVFGGCPIINDFDVIAPAGSATLEMCYDPRNEDDDSNPAIIVFDTTNTFDNRVAVVLSGFSFHNVRCDRQWQWDREVHLANIMWYLGVWTHLGGAGDDPSLNWTNHLAQNFPNPFNPVTTIRYSIQERDHVSLKIYNVAGQLVKTLVNETKRPGIIHEVRWDGRSDSGDPAASGVYFYKLVTKSYAKTKKMVLLK
ncbi:MAG: T9SS type A sorting domain-containing protein [Candidatus Latescibacteria bacterium]|nr:T9SS type A sorting domain-containing protein [Candidatus Latescibacterota bacterium]NIM22407.1 T9SS type A sorting domain-containing protein [Candidatus Latescibacterota bacterium]NIM64767.1 T9SS type A sorting domain-containing protein [Candidatus Latescibacterota bacterium]NIO01278.1 T9SS type A sorting domain-containing protein [Candidatus Latescibacterota bacterium]NIO27770.1 T9SS type A sorting domain-containing protein [Candidatus Latescibacterota bacterium]